MMEIQFDPKKGIWAKDEETVEKLSKNFFGRVKGNIVILEIEEALYLVNFQNTKCLHNGREIGFNELASHFSNEKRLFIRYSAYRDWRDRGLVIARSNTVKKKGNVSKGIDYPKQMMNFKKINATIQWDPGSLFSTLEDTEISKKLFNDYWFGQLGIYKQDRGHLLKLNFLETLFLSKHMGVKVMNSNRQPMTHEEIFRQVTGMREYTKQLYDVYEDWRLSGFVVKTGFKFGSHFRIYFPGASPAKGGKWVHSKHVLHVFPKEQRLLISEWARVVRVAHSVKKTFILGVPKLSKKDLVDYPADFVAYRRKKHKGQLIRETPEDSPRYLLAAVSEDEHIGGIELSSLLLNAEERGLDLILSITDRESSVTYYLLKRIHLSNSEYEYYEIEWHKP